MTSFSLIEEPWVPVVIGGARREVSLRRALVEAHVIDGLAWDEPLHAVAVLRQVLLPVVLAALGVPADRAGWAARWGAGSFDAGSADAGTCGNASQPCCAGSVCTAAGTDCISGQCIACGLVFEPCCNNNVCTGSTVR